MFRYWCKHAFGSRRHGSRREAHTDVLAACQKCACTSLAGQAIDCHEGSTFKFTQQINMQPNANQANYRNAKPSFQGQHTLGQKSVRFRRAHMEMLVASQNSICTCVIISHLTHRDMGNIGLISGASLTMCSRH